MADAPTVLVFSAHAADFVWRAGGAIALYASRGHRVRILCLSYGERGESQGAWKQPGMTVERAKEIRRAESQRAAGLLGADVRFFDAGDYPLRTSDELMEALVQDTAPAGLFSSSHIPTRTRTTRITRRRMRFRCRHGFMHRPKGTRFRVPLSARRPCSCSSRTSPNSAASSRRSCSTSRRSGKRSARRWNRWKRRATWSSTYSDLSRRRGSQAVRNSGRKGIQHAEAFQRVFPQVTGDFT